MKYLKIEYIVIFCITIYFLVQFYLLPKAKIKINKLELFQKETIKIPIEVISYKDGVYEIFSFRKEKNKKIFYPESYTILLRKGQRYFFEYKLDKNFFNETSTYLYLVSKDLITKKNILYKKLLIKIPSEEKTKVSISTASLTFISKKETIQPQLSPKPEPKIDVKTKSEIAKEIEQNFEIHIDSHMIKPQYYYNSTLSIPLKLTNKSLQTLPLNIEANFKNEEEIIVSSRTLSLKISPQTTQAISINFDIIPSITPGKYFIEIIFLYLKKKIKTTTEKFLIKDIPPKIIFQEQPIIKYNSTNTILIEVEDDRGINEVKFIEVDDKRKTKKENYMALIAGNKLLGLYSFTTSKITKKDYYSFYIQVSDIAGNITTTEVFKTKIVK